MNFFGTFFGIFLGILFIYFSSFSVRDDITISSTSSFSILQELLFSWHSVDVNRLALFLSHNPYHPEGKLEFLCLLVKVWLSEEREKEKDREGKREKKRRKESEGERERERMVEREMDG